MKAPIRKLTTSAAVVALTMGMLFSLSGCMVNPIEKLVGDGVGEVLKKSGVDVDLKNGGASLPKDFPSSVPLASKDILTGASVTVEGKKMWTIRVKASAAAGDYEQIKSQLEAAGFTETFSGSGATGATASFEGRDDYTVMLTTAIKKDSTEVSYIVTRAKE